MDWGLLLRVLLPLLEAYELRHYPQQKEFARKVFRPAKPPRTMDISFISNIPAYRSTGPKSTDYVGNWEPGPRDHVIDAFVFHWMVGTLAGTDATFKNENNRACAHFGVEDGTVHQYVKIQDIAFAAGSWSWNERAISFEISADLTRPASDATYETIARLVVNIAQLLGRSVVTFQFKRHQDVSDHYTQCCGTVDVNRILQRALQIEAYNQGLDFIVAVAHVPAATFAPFETNLEPSQNYSDEVKRMQEFLVAKGFMHDQGQNDGYYGPITQAAVNGFQRANGIYSDKQYFGWWYKRTRDAANAQLQVQSTTNA